MSSSVHVKEAILITPSDQTPSTILPLSSLDSQLFLRFTIEYLLVYKPVPGLKKPGLIERIKSALGQALVLYYPLAGRVRSRSDGSGLEVFCGSQGALFIEAEVLDRTLFEEFEKAPRFGTSWRKFLSVYVADVLKGAPPVVVQLTWLSDDGATLCVGINHCLIDGIGSGMFLNSFAELARGECGLTGLKPMPVWDRHLMSPNPMVRARANLLSHPEFNRVPDLCGFTSRFIQEDLEPTQIIFTRRKLNELRKLAVSTSWLTESLCTMFEVLSAHVWRSWARALNLPSNQILKMLFSINIRNRVKPSVPSFYYGNAFVLGCAQTSVRDLTEKGLGYATELVKRAKERVDDEHVREVIESVSSNQVCPDSVGVLIVSQWSWLGLDKVDFGMGNPTCVAPVCTDKYCIFSPVPNQLDAIKVNVAIPSCAVDQYLNHVRNPYT
ncbi:acetyltransferase [Lithospermum erythrorhizon]|uniref:Acetyltransferase n=1 Tax=Lithospermum erythrorhizon TaxID=34254 RepID=A0AAV3Q0N7_LITER